MSRRGGDERGRGIGKSNGRPGKRRRAKKKRRRAKSKTKVLEKKTKAGDLRCLLAETFRLHSVAGYDIISGVFGE